MEKKTLNDATSDDLFLANHYRAQVAGHITSWVTGYDLRPLQTIIKTIRKIAKNWSITAEELQSLLDNTGQDSVEAFRNQPSHDERKRRLEELHKVL